LIKTKTDYLDHFAEQVLISTKAAFFVGKLFIDFVQYGISEKLKFF